jgi:tetratricopeptide (TPR) repeat protein
LPLLILLAASAWAYAPSLGHEFLANWDDSYYVTDNKAVHGFTISHLQAAFSRFFVGNYAPVQIISYMLDYTLWGLRASGFIFTNLVLHFFNGVLLYALAIRHQGSRVIASVAGFLFLCHPVQVESVVWISQRKNLLAMFLVLVALHLFLQYRSGDRHARSCYIAALIAFILALLTKSVAVIFPLILVAYDVCLDQNSPRIRLKEKVPFLVAAIAVGVLAWISQDPAWGSGGGRVSFHGGTFLTNLYTTVTILPRYLLLLLRPDLLSVMYAPPVKTTIDPVVAGSLLLMAILALVAVILYRRNRPLLFWYLLFFLGFLPVSQIIPLVTLMNDRYFYFPMLGLAMFLPLLATTLVASIAVQWHRPLAIMVCLALLPLPFLAEQRSRVWHDAIVLWRDAHAKLPENKTIKGNLVQALAMKGEDFRKQKDYPAALTWFRQALTLDPLDQFTLNNIAFACMEQGDFQSARGYLVTLTSTYPRDLNGLLNLGFTNNFLGDLSAAAAAYQRALELQPESVTALRGLADIYTRQGRQDLAEPLYRQAEVVERAATQFPKK